ncbi:MAG: arginase [Chloroflexi bacterium]|nr:MAG: arginase [Chloroflexota bacterium]
MPLKVRELELIGVPCDFGAGRRGVDMGPSAMRYAGLAAGLQALGHSVRDAGDLQLAHVPAGRAEPEPRLRHLAEVLAMSRAVAERTAASVARGSLPLVLGGDHSVALGAVCGAARSQTLGVLWVDAHGDFNTAQSSPSGNIHGMPLAALCGLGDPRLSKLGARMPAVQPQHVALLGVRNLDAGEHALLQSAGVAVYDMAHIDRFGMAASVEAALAHVLKNCSGLYLSLDMDALDPLYAPGVGTPVPGGLSYREAHLACELVAARGCLLAMDVVEVNPVLDEHNRTAQVAVDLVLSALGKRVWEPA